MSDKYGPIIGSKFGLIIGGNHAGMYHAGLDNAIRLMNRPSKKPMYISPLEAENLSESFAGQFSTYRWFPWTTSEKEHFGFWVHEDIKPSLMVEMLTKAYVEQQDRQLRNNYGKGPLECSDELINTLARTNLCLTNPTDLANLVMNICSKYLKWED